MVSPRRDKTSHEINLPAATPKNPIILAHGLLGFSELRLAGSFLPGVHYWRGITEALAAKGIEVIPASVPASASIEERAIKLGRDISQKANGRSVNIVAYVGPTRLKSQDDSADCD